MQWLVTFPLEFIQKYVNSDYVFNETEKANLKQFTIVADDEHYDAEVINYIKEFVNGQMKFIKTIKIEGERQSKIFGSDFLEIMRKLTPVRVSVPVLSQLMIVLD